MFPTLQFSTLNASHRTPFVSILPLQHHAGDSYYFSK